MKTSVLVFSILLAIPVLANAQSFTKFVSDELVQDLSCESLNADAIYRAVRPEAFQQSRRIVLKNFSDEAFQGQCWSLARTQRLNLLLGRQDHTAAFDSRAIEAMISTAAVPPSEAGIELPEYNPNAPKANIGQTVERNALSKWILGPDTKRAAEAATFGQIYLNRLDQMLKRDIRKILQLPWLSKYKTFSWPEETSKAIKRFIDAIRVGQTRLFLRKENVEYLHVEQSEAGLKNQLGRIAKLTREKKLPLINMRESKKDQHIVVAHTFQVIEKDHYYIGIIDSNAPNDSTRAIEIKRVNGRLIAWYGSQKDIFLVEENERPKLDNALVRHYRRMCQ
jgi:hypothetical protein